MIVIVVDQTTMVDQWNDLMLLKYVYILAGLFKLFYIAKYWYT